MKFSRIAESYGTPTYVYDRSVVRQAHAELRRTLPATSVLYYSLKANPHPDIAAQLAELGCRAEISSAGELQIAMGAGFDKQDLLMTGPGKTHELLAAALEQDVRRFSVDSPGDLDRLNTISRQQGRTVDFLLRVNADTPVPGMGMSMTGTASQFGADASWLLAEPERFRSRDSAHLAGLHLYMGTNVEDPEVLAEQLATSIELAGRLRSALGLRLDEVNLGGGFGHPYAHDAQRPSYPDLAGRLEPLLDAHLAGWRERAPLVSFESGRYLVGASGTLLCRVVDVKISKGRTFVILDSGINHLGGMSGLRRLPRIVPDLLGPDTDDGIADCVVAGPLCTPLDTWSVGVPLPSLQPGDLLAVPNVGAYGLTASLLAFLGHDPAREVVIDDVEVISATQLTLQRVAVTGQPVGEGTAADEIDERRRARFEAILRSHLPLLPTDRQLDHDAPLLRLGLDSLQAVTLILELEDELGVMLPDSGLTPATFASATSLWAVIDEACREVSNGRIAASP